MFFLAPFIGEDLIKVECKYSIEDNVDYMHNHGNIDGIVIDFGVEVTEGDTLAFSFEEDHDIEGK